MKKLLIVMAIVTLFSLTFASYAYADHGDPVGGCPDSFWLDHAMNHDEPHHHHHVGTDTDLNGDGYICMKHVGKDGKNHVHIDNNVPLG